MTSRRCLAGAVGIAALLGGAGAASAQVDPAEPPADPTNPDVEPELAIGIRAVTSVNGALTEGGDAISAIDFSDTYVFLRPRVALRASEMRAGALFGVTFPDVYDEPGTLLVADAHAFLDHRLGTLRVGRGRLKSRLIPFPTLRDDDLIRYTDAQNPFSEGLSTADLQYGNTVDLSLWPAPRWYLEVHAENLSASALRPSDESAFRINSVGFDAGYRQIPALSVLSALRQVAIGVNAYHVKADGQRWTGDALAATWLGLLVDPVHAVDLRLQLGYGLGIDGVTPDTPAATQQARAVSAAASLGYTYRRRLVPTLRTNVLSGFRRYTEADRTQWSVVANAFYAVGPAVEVGAQYQYQRNDAALPDAFGEDQEHSIKLALIARFETVLGRLFDERDSLLNTEGGYLP